MRQAVLSVTHETLSEFGFGVFQDAGLRDIETLSCDGARGVARIRVTEQPDEHRLDTNDTIQWWERVSNEGSGYVYLVEMNVANALATRGVDADSILRVERSEVHKEEITTEHVGSHEQIGNMVADLDGAGFDITVQKLQDYRVQETPLDGLTPRQQEVLEIAYEFGYYDVPRQSSTTEIGAELGVDDSTVSEHLQRAERNLLATIFGS